MSLSKIKTTKAQFNYCLLVWSYKIKLHKIKQQNKRMIATTYAYALLQKDG